MKLSDFTKDWISIFINSSNNKVRSFTKRKKEQIEHKSNKDKIAYSKPQRSLNPFKRKKRVSY